MLVLPSCTTIQLRVETHGDDLLFEGDESWLDEMQMWLERVMISKRRAN